MAGTYETNVDMDDGTTIYTTVTSSANDVAAFLQGLEWRRGQIVGLDAEWRPNFQPGGQPNMIAVLQICVGSRCLVYQIFHSDAIPGILASFLSNSSLRFVGVGIDGDAQKLLEDYGLRMASTVDLRHAAAEVMGWPELRQAGLKDLAFEVAGLRINKPRSVTMSNWAAQYLSFAQVKYATMDAYVSYEIGRCLLTNS